jgi:hypothetical protein
MYWIWHLINNTKNNRTPRSKPFGDPSVVHMTLSVSVIKTTLFPIGHQNNNYHNSRKLTKKPKLVAKPIRKKINNFLKLHIFQIQIYFGQLLSKNNQQKKPNKLMPSRHLKIYRIQPYMIKQDPHK